MEHGSIPDSRQALTAMLAHAAAYSPYYRQQAWAERLRAGEKIDFRDIAITSKGLVRTETERFFSTFVPPEDGEVVDKSTSGSTGEPMRLRKTQRHFRYNALENQRLKEGWGFNRHRRTAHFRIPNDEHPKGAIEESDGPGGGRLWELFDLDTRAAFDLLRRTGATLAIGMPSIMLAVLERCEETSQALPLQLISTVSEIVPDRLRELVRGLPGLRHIDIYGCVEAGLIAVQCASCGAYHPAGRHLVFELVTDDGRPAGPGEMGRVVVTPLFNTATPLLRYETGDYATWAEDNHCARSPRAICRIDGRERNLFKLPDGRKIMPLLPNRVVSRLPLRQFKLVQTTSTDVELRYIPQSDDMEIPNEVAQDVVDRYMATGFKVRAVRMAEIPRAPNGKYFMYECLI
jgi:phenylacetate-CoA ligase